MGETPVRRWPWWRIVTIVVAVFLVVAAAVVVPIVRGLYNPPLGELPERADAMVVFGGEDIRTRNALRMMHREIAPVIVVSFGHQDNFARYLCGQQEPFEVMCVVPEDVSTRGEAQMFGELAEQYGWDSIVAMTGNYHVQRARTYLDRCFDGELTFTAVDWPYYTRRIVRHETLGNIHARYLARNC